MVAIAANIGAGLKRPLEITFRSPVYGTSAGVQLHRYTDPDFVEQFLAELAAQRLGDVNWMQSDRFGDFADHVTLRLPVHRTFYQVSVELCCNRVGYPALDPARIANAGFVVRRVGAGRNDAWMLTQGVATGWSPAAGEERDPDLSNRLCRDGKLRAQPQPAYSGEEVHPLRALVDRSTGRSRTILHGYLPLGGQYYFRDKLPQVNAAEQEDAVAFKALLWPFGSRGEPADKSVNPLQVQRGVPSRAFAELLTRLIYEEHLHERNDELVELCRRTFFYDLDDAPVFADRTRHLYHQLRRFSLFDYLTEWATSGDDQLLLWVMRFNKDDSLDRLPPRQAQRGSLDLSLLISRADAQEYQTQLEQTILGRFDAARREIPVPKFQQRELDVYRLVPFVRYRDDAGALRIYWGRDADRSDPFRVAAPFDPQASRPSLVQVPSLRDLKRGLANGVGLMTPADTMDLLNQLRTEEGMAPEVVPDEQGPGLGLQWICSFSIPIVTVAAMIVLMIIVSILNFFLQWLPYVRICFPLPSVEDEQQ